MCPISGAKWEPAAFVAAFPWFIECKLPEQKNTLIKPVLHCQLYHNLFFLYPELYPDHIA